MIYLLTTSEHIHSIWNEKLKSSLEEVGSECSIISLEDYTYTLLNPFPKGSVVVNRVADASYLFEEATMFFECCRLWKVPVWNDCYSFVSRKWVQNAIFKQANLNIPNTKRIFNGQVKDCPSLPYLFKPNGGGFSDGIEKYDEIPDLVDVRKNGLVQEYLQPQDLFRVWFLQGKIQCAVVRREEDIDNCPCAAESTALRAIQLCPEAIDEIEKRLLPLIPNANCGSVEFLVQKDSKKRWYFDLNLVSTLPIEVNNSLLVWGENYAPWKELASAIIAWQQDQTM